MEEFIVLFGIRWLRDLGHSLYENFVFVFFLSGIIQIQSQLLFKHIYDKRVFIVFVGGGTQFTREHKTHTKHIETLWKRRAIEASEWFLAESKDQRFGDRFGQIS